MSSNNRGRVAASALAASAVVLAAAFETSFAAADLAAVEAVPQRGQTAEQGRRDRYECHNWAVEQTQAVPRRVDPDEEAAIDRAERVERVLTGASVGAAAGAIVRATQNENTSHGVLSGAAIGAAIGALIGRRAKADDSEFEEYFRALSACLEGRGYEVVIRADPDPGAEVAAAR